jgi:uncharacterized membrane protein YfcA
MEPLTLAALMAAFCVAAILYSSVGHGGASAYLAIMALFALPPEIMRPTALCLNILVASLGAYRFVRAGRFDARLFFPLALGAVPFAFVGGGVQLPAELYRPLLGVVLLLAALRLALPDPKPVPEDAIKAPHPVLGVASGCGIGLLSGLTGTGGGIFLSPLAIFLKWAKPETTTGVAACFIVANSAAGLAGNVAQTQDLPDALPLLLAAVAVGGLIGTWLGVARYSTATLRWALALVMVVAGAKLLFT